MNYIKKYATTYKDYLYVIFRVFIGTLFFQHGAQKLFGWFGGTATPVASLFGVAGVVELVAGAFITLGLFTRISAFFSAGQMTVAYFMVHLPEGWIPIENKGELALLYFACFLVMMYEGDGKWSLGRMWFWD
ncbi:MAG: DoxX family protein [Nanoarchaeota archaeon]